MNKKIFVTQPSLPPLNEFINSLEKIWASKRLTNNGEFHQEFEKQLGNHLGVKYISLFANGTLALTTAIQALDLQGEVITTPYSFIATAHALWWNKIIPVFVDVDPKYGNLDPGNIEAAISEKTTAILPVHVYGNPCEHKMIRKIADKHNLKLIYDAAHAFGVEENGESILNFGDLSILSFHATKVFNTLEGGAIISHSANMKKHIDSLKNFGFENEVSVIQPGINGKMNEFQAAFGLLQLREIDQNIQKRKAISQLYRNYLSDISGIEFIEEKENTLYNYSYFPIFIDAKKYGMQRDELYQKLKDHNVYSRRYFYPLITNFYPYNKIAKFDLKIAEKLAKKVICLPIYTELEDKNIERIVHLIKT